MTCLGFIVRVGILGGGLAEVLLYCVVMLGVNTAATLRSLSKERWQGHVPQSIRLSPCCRAREPQ